MHLGDGGGGQRGLAEGAEHVAHRPSQFTLDDAARLGPGERRHLVLQSGEFVGDILGQHVTARGQELSELDEHRAQVLERHAQTLRARGIGTAAKPVPGQEAEQEAHRPQQVRGENDLVQAVADENALDRQQAEQFTGVDHEHGS